MYLEYLNSVLSSYEQTTDLYPYFLYIVIMLTKIKLTFFM